MSKETRLCFLHIGAALGLGLLLYLFLRQNTYLHTILETVLHCEVPNIRCRTAHLRFAANWLGDFLWGYALCFALYRILSLFHHRLLGAVLAASALGVLLECLQKAQIISGTFDLLDILAEAAAAVLAAIIIKRSLSS